MSLIHRIHTHIHTLSRTLHSLPKTPISFHPLHYPPIKLMSSSSSSPTSISWTCSQCTFTNPNSHQPTCQICLTPQAQTHVSSSSSKPTWSCKSCTFHNSYKNNNCQICGTRASASLLTTLETDYDDEIDPSVGSVFLPLQRCKRKIGQVKEMGLAGSNGSGLFTSVKSAKNEVAVLGIFRFLIFF